MSWTFEATQAGYANLWKTATLKDGADAENANRFADKIIAGEQRYRTVQNATGVPWYNIGALHMRESSCDFDGVLHNGEKIIGTGKVTSLVPAGRGPFATWEEAAIDALKLVGMNRVQGWSAARLLYEDEGFNGYGYVAKGVNSPYLWAGTNHEQRGKYVADGQFDPNADDTQLGVAAVLIRLAQKRADIRADLYPATPTPQPETPVTDPAAPATTDQILAAINGLRSDIGQLVSALKGLTAPASTTQPATPAAPVTPSQPAPATTTPATPVLQQPGVGLGALGLVLTGLLQAFGVVGPSTGDAATTAGQVLPIISGGTAMLGATGTWGAVASILGTVLSAFFQKKS